jgi:rhodanese-related sulfurtransferase
MSAITVDQLKEALQKGERIQIIDVREPGEFSAEHIPGAVNMPLGEIEQRLGDMNSDPIVLVCHSGERSEMACDRLTSDRETKVLEGGTSAWQQAGHEVLGCTKTRWALERQTRLGAGVLVLAGTILSLTVAPAWIYLAMFVGAGLTFAGATNICGMGLLLAKMPWNGPAATCQTTPTEAKQ